VVVLRDAEAGRALQSLKAHASEVSRLVFSFDGTRFATASFAGEVTVWDPSTGAELCGIAGFTVLVGAATTSRRRIGLDLFNPSAFRPARNSACRRPSSKNPGKSVRAAARDRTRSDGELRNT
jgi:hypothetical protein